MSSLETEDYFDIPAESNPAESKEFKPLWSGADAHLTPQNRNEVEFLVTNSRFNPASSRSKIQSKLLKAMELQESPQHVQSSEQGSVGSSDR